jgi:zinc transport system substrate-binding protein
MNEEMISVSILPQKYLVEKLLGDTVQVNVMIPKGSSPATYSPSPNQMKSISQSSLYLQIGHIGFEMSWMDRMKELNGKMKVYDTSKGIEYIKGEGHVHGDHYHEGGIDPHIWTSPKTMLHVLKNTQNALEENYPTLKKNIQANGNALQKQIYLLDSLYNASCSKLSKRSFLIFHPAYSYLARDYGLEQISVEHNGKEPSLKWLKQVIEEAEEKEIGAVFIQQEFDKRNAELIASEIGIPLVQVNPLSEQWDVEMLRTLDYLNQALK